MLCTPLFIFTSTSSALRAPTLWFIHLTFPTCHIQYTPSEFMPIPCIGKWTKPKNTWSRPFSYHRALILRAPVTFLSQWWPALTLCSAWTVKDSRIVIFQPLESPLERGNKIQTTMPWPHTSYSTILLLAKSALFPDKAITIFALAWRCSSFTHVFARANVSWLVMSYTTIAACAPR